MPRRAAASLTAKAVWEAVDAAKDGDIVQLPAGTAVWTKGWNAGHWAKMKAITIQGAGIDKTIIRTDTSRAPGDKSFVVNGVEGKPFRITGITFDGTGFPNAGIWAGEVVINGNCKNFRVDHCSSQMDQMMTITGTPMSPSPPFSPLGEDHQVSHLTRAPARSTTKPLTWSLPKRSTSRAMKPTSARRS